MNCLPLLSIFIFCVATVDPANSSETYLALRTDNSIFRSSAEPLVALDIASFYIPISASFVLKALLLTPYTIVLTLSWYTSSDLARVRRLRLKLKSKFATDREESTEEETSVLVAGTLSNRQYAYLL